MAFITFPKKKVTSKATNPFDSIKNAQLNRLKLQREQLQQRISDEIRNAGNNEEAQEAKELTVEELKNQAKLLEQQIADMEKEMKKSEPREGSKEDLKSLLGDDGDGYLG